mmetsp:Transcript_35529/g.62706  ORF Transcript_35529/g.62706 Transcript_35529/m.62706 type:complete len:1089 (-) Transcript_35529:56-3322(-)
MRSSMGMSRATSAPTIVRERRAATQALLHATATANVTALRRLAVRKGAEISGIRAYDLRGNAPLELLAQMEHLTPIQKAQVKKQLIELPRLMSAADAARSPQGGFQTAHRATNDPLASDSVTLASDSVTLAPEFETRRARTAMPSIKDRQERSKKALTILGSSQSAPDLAIEAALARPRILQSPPDAAGAAMATLAATLRSEDIAVRAIRRNPSLLERPADKYQQVVPVLMGLLGGEETAYALTARPEMLEIDRPQQIRETMQALSDSLNSQQDAMWLVVQTLAPPTIKVYSRAWCHENLVGEYIRVKGARSFNRPVYKKPAKSLAHHKAEGYARDMYIVFMSGDGSGKTKDRWLITPVWDERATRSGMGMRKSPAFEREALGQIASSHLSPDQALGTWSLLDTDGKGAWEPEPDFKVLDPGTKRGPALLTVPPARVRSAYNHLKEALSAYWMLEVCGKPLREAPGQARIIGNLRRNDSLHMGGGGDQFKYLGDFAPTQGFGYIYMTAAAREHPIVLIAWEPVTVYMMYSREPPKEEDPEEAAEAAAAAAKAKPKAGAKGGSKEPPPDAEEEEVSDWTKDLAALGWLPALDIGTGMRPPETPKPINFVLKREFVRGRVDIPAHAGPEDPPLLFVKQRLAARTPDLTPCQAWSVAKPGEPIFLGEEKPPPVDAHAEEAGEEVAIDWPMRLELVGEVGYAHGFQMIKAPKPSCPCPPSDVQLIIDTADPVQVVVVWFYVPEPAPADEHPRGSISRGSVSKERGSVAGRASQILVPEAELAAVAPKEAPPPPAWVDAEGWKALECNLPVVLKYGQEDTVSAPYIYTKNFQPGEIAIHGSAEATTLVFWQYTTDPRPDPLQKLLPKRPSLLACGSSFTLLMRRLRAELGDAGARRVVVDQVMDWSNLCEPNKAGEVAGPEEVEAWVLERKMHAFGAELRGVSQAKALVEREPDLAGISAPIFSERCATLYEGLGGRSLMLDVITRLPVLLLTDAALLRRSVTALKGLLGDKRMRHLVSERPQLLLMAELLEKLFGKLESKFSHKLVAARFKEPSTEWAQWPDMVQRQEGEVATWIGRLIAEERSNAARAQAL